LPFSQHQGELRVLLVTSRETRRWVLPKGWMEKRLAPHALAAKEAFEEAGVLGSIERRPVGRYDYLKRVSAKRLKRCSVRVFALRVERMLDDWPERRQRERRWCSPAEAAMAVEEGGLVTLFLQLALPDAGTEPPPPYLTGASAVSPHRDASESDRHQHPRPFAGRSERLQGGDEPVLEGARIEKLR